MPIGTLYKFFKVTDYNLTSCAISSLWFAHVDSFNDPFEGKIEFHFPDYSPEAFENVLASSKKIHITKDLDLLETGFITNSHQGYMKLLKLLKFMLMKVVNANNDHIGVCCFVKGQEQGLLMPSKHKPHDQYQNMWSHYGDGLRGFCIEFDGDILINSLIDQNIQKTITSASVNYIYNRTPIDFINFTKQFADEDDETNKERLFFTLLHQRNQKNWCWREESELRFNALSAVNTNLKFDPSSIKSVSFGCRMKPDSAQALQKIFKTLGVEKFYQVSPNQTNFSYETNPVMDI